MFATDSWVRRAILGDPTPWDPLGLPWDAMPDIPGVLRGRNARRGSAHMPTAGAGPFRAQADVGVLHDLEIAQLVHSDAILARQQCDHPFGLVQADMPAA